MAFTYGATAQDAIALQVWGLTYLGLKTEQKEMLDGTVSVPGAPTGGVAYQILTQLEQIGQWYELAGASSVPQAWEPYLVAASVAELYKSQRPERYGSAVKAAGALLDSLIDSYSKTAADSATITGQTINAEEIRYYVMVRANKRKPRRLFPSVEMIDTALQWAWNDIWNRKPWAFRKRQVTLKIVSSTGTAQVTVSAGLASGEYIDSFSSRKWYYSDSNSYGSVWAQWAGPDEMAQLRAYYASASTTGRPLKFRFQGMGGRYTTNTTTASTTAFALSLDMVLAPAPDKTYTAYADVLVACPTLASSATDTATMDLLPREFKPGLRDLVLAKVIEDMTGDSRAMQAANDDIDRFFPEAHNYGVADDVQASLDVYGDVNALGSGYGQLGGGL